MGHLTVLPYAHDHGAIEVTVSFPGTELTQRPDGSWDAWSAGARSLTAVLELAVDEAALSACLAPGEDPFEALEFVALVRSAASRLRSEHQFVLLDGTRRAHVPLELEQLFGRVEIRCVARRKYPSPVHLPAVARRRTAVVARSESTVIWVDEPQHSSGNAFDVRWQDFTVDLPESANDLFALRIEDRPVVLLNSATPFALEILNSKGTHGLQARVRDSTFAQIIHQTWSSVLSHCFLEILRHPQDIPSHEVVDSIGGWEYDVLQSWVHAFVDCEDDFGALAALVEQLRTPGDTTLVEVLPRVVQERCSTSNAFSGWVKELSKSTGDDA